MKKIFLAMALTIGLMADAQVKIGANPTSINAGSLLELENSSGTKQGFLLPRVALSNTTTPTLDGGTNVEGMTVYNTATAGDVTPGLYTNDGSKWVKVGATAALNITSEQTGNYTALASDDIILYNNTTVGTILTLPTVGIVVGKRYYVTNKGTQNLAFLPTLRENGYNLVYPGFSAILTYLGGTSWSLLGS